MSIPLIPFAVSGGAAEGAATIIEKNILRKRKVDYKTYTVYGFFIISMIALFILLFLGDKYWIIKQEALQLKNVLILIFIIFSAVLANLLTFYAMKWEKITEMEPLRLFQPIFIILLAFIFYESERQNPTSVIVAAMIASLALLFSHVKKHHFKLNKYLIATLLGSLFFAIELVFSKLILSYYSSLSFYFIRCAIIFISTLIVLRPSPKSVDKKSWLYMITASAIWIGYRMLMYQGYVVYGIIFTTLLFILGPIFIYLFATIFLKEKFTWKNIVSTIIIIVCVAWAVSQT